MPNALLAFGNIKAINILSGQASELDKELKIQIAPNIFVELTWIYFLLVCCNHRPPEAVCCAAFGVRRRRSGWCDFYAHP